MKISKLKNWFLNSKRDFPWRDNPNPYQVWVSEVMLQQTQAAVVVPYYLRWMERFPTIESLAKANIDEVVKMWEGLGYYSRARNLHEGAQYVVNEFKGILPSTYEGLSKIKGLGPYTIGAILSFAFHQKISAVDGNVIRVLSRYYAIEDDIGKPKTVNKLRELASSILPDQEPWIFNEALIELGATVCMRKPQCFQCPLNGSCKAFSDEKVDRIPYKSTKTKIEKLLRAVAVVKYQDSLLVKKGSSGAIMEGLYEFPYFEMKDVNDEKGATDKILQELNMNIVSSEILSIVSHSFTRYQVTLKPILFHTKIQFKTDNYEWMTYEELQKLAFSSGHRRIFQSIKQHFT